MAVDDVFPIVTSADLDRLLPFYRDVLGGEVRYQFPPEGPRAEDPDGNQLILGQRAG